MPVDVMADRQSLEMLEQIGRHLRGKPSLIWKFCWQAAIITVDITLDANWAVVGRVRQSTSGGNSMIGAHLIRTYSKTQATVANSSGESELYAVVRASAEGPGMVSLLSVFGDRDPRVSIGMDASAAIGMAQGTGLSKARRVEVDVFGYRSSKLEDCSRLPRDLGRKTRATSARRMCPSHCSRSTVAS